MKNKLLMQVLGCGAILATSFPSVAQDLEVESSEQEEEDVIIVTGSRIARSAFDTVQPSLLLDRPALEERGFGNIADAINEQAAFGVPGDVPVGPSLGDNEGQNQLNFLGLGPNRTLTLVNSKRFVSSNSVTNLNTAGLQVDLNSIPFELVERVETIAVGGAPIYGADAIAGTVNIILKDNFEGLSLTAQGGLSIDEGDTANYRFSAVRGANFNDDRGNLTVAFDYAKSNGYTWADRPETAGRGWSFEGPTDPDSPFSLVLSENVTVGPIPFEGLPLFSNVPFFLATFGNAIPLNPSDPNSPLSRFDDNGNLVAYDPGLPTTSPVFTVGGDGADLTTRRSLAHDLTRINANILARYDLTDSVKFKAEGWFARSNAEEVITETAYQSVLFTSAIEGFTDYTVGPVPVLLSNPFVTPSTRATIGDFLDMDSDGTPDPNIDTDGDGISDAAGFYVERAMRNLSERNVAAEGVSPSRAEKTVLRTVASLLGDFNLGEREYSWEVAYVYGKSRNRGLGNRIVRERFVQAANVVLDPISGQPVCADPSGGCVPLNVMSAVADSGAIDFIFGLDERISENIQHIASANISGPVLTLPAGDLSMAAGFDYRVEKASFEPSELETLGLFDFSSARSILGEYNTKEFYGEALIPLLSSEMDSRLGDSLEIEGAARYVENSIAGGDVTWTVGGRYRPIPDIEFRGNLTTSIRAPATTELFLPQTQVLVNANDPCDSRYINQGNFPDRRAANCAAEGIAQPFGSVISDAGLFGTSTGNPDLMNETADSWSAGVILRPRGVQNFILSADWINIDISNAIENLNAQSIMDACYDSANYPNEPACDRFSRFPDGQVDGSTFRTGFVNIGRLEFAGLLANLSYSKQIDRFGEFQIGLNGIYTEKLTRTTGSENPDPVAGEIGNSKYRIVGNVNWQRGRLRFGNQVRWLSSAVFDNADGEFTRDVKGVPSWWVLNSSLNYEVKDNIGLQINVDNVFDRKAPDGLPGLFGFSNVTSYYQGIIGRTARATLRMKF